MPGCTQFMNVIVSGVRAEIQRGSPHVTPKGGLTKQEGPRTAHHLSVLPAGALYGKMGILNLPSKQDDVGEW